MKNLWKQRVYPRHVHGGFIHRYTAAQLAPPRLLQAASPVVMQMQTPVGRVGLTGRVKPLCV